MKPETLIILLVLTVILVVAVLRSVKHFRGGGCCGSGGNTIRDKKTLTGEKLGEKILVIDGMHCVNCEIRVENALNRIENVACRVNWKKKTARVAYSAEPDEALLRNTVEKLGYQVLQIQG